MVDISFEHNIRNKHPIMPTKIWINNALDINMLLLCLLFKSSLIYLMIALLIPKSKIIRMLINNKRIDKRPNFSIPRFSINIGYAINTNNTGQNCPSKL